MHLDLAVDDLVEAEQRATALGAVRAGVMAGLHITRTGSSTQMRPGGAPPLTACVPLVR